MSFDEPALTRVGDKYPTGEARYRAASDINESKFVAGYRNPSSFSGTTKTSSNDAGSYCRSKGCANKLDS